jgi:hypothetical protein
MGVASWGRRRSEGKLASLGGGAIGGGGSGGGGGGPAAEFKFLAGNTVAAPAVGSAGTFTRTTIAYQINSSGVMTQVSSGTFRNAHYVNGTQTFLLESASTNICINSDNLGAWTLVSTPTLTAGQADIYGTTLGYNVNATGGAAVQGVVITLNAPTGNTIHGCTVCVKKGASPPANGSLITYRDTTAPADRLKGTLTWSGANPSMAMTTGTYFGALALTGGWFALLFQTTALTAANTHTLELDANGTLTDTGDVYFGGVMCDHFTNSPPTTIMPTTGAPASRNAETLIFPHNSIPQQRTLYAKIISVAEYGASNSTLFSIGNTTDGQSLRNGSGAIPPAGETGILNNAAAASNGIPVLAGWVNGATIDVRSSGDATPKEITGMAVNGGAETTANGAGIAAYGGTYGTVNFQIGNNQAGSAAGSTAFLEVCSALGVQTMATMRTL